MKGQVKIVIKIELVSILATVINLLILFLLVNKFFTKPLANIIAKREELVKSQFEQAKIAEQEAQELKIKYEDSLKNAKEESVALVNKAKEDANREYDRIISEADKKAKEIIKKAGADANLEREQALKEVKAEIGGLIASAVEKVEKEKASAETDKKIINQFLSDVGMEED